MKKGKPRLPPIPCNHKTKMRKEPSRVGTKLGKKREKMDKGSGKFTVLLDNGHGAGTPGKRSPDGWLKEYRWARETASLVALALRGHGVDARLLVPEEEDVPLRERVARANAACRERGKDGVLLVSVHVNASGNGKGWR